MEILEIIEKTTHIADTITRIANYKWTRSNLIGLAITTALICVASSTVLYMQKRKERYIIT